MITAQGADVNAAYDQKPGGDALFAQTTRKGEVSAGNRSWQVVIVWSHDQDVRLATPVVSC